ncbi:MAG: hypothetical protein ACI8PT_004794, partial [Gammaproteobacteria bacterium]
MDIKEAARGQPRLRASAKWTVANESGESGNTMTTDTDSEFIDLDDLDPDAWNDYAQEQGWSDGFPLVMPTEVAV